MQYIFISESVGDDPPSYDGKKKRFCGYHFDLLICWTEFDSQCVLFYIKM